MSSLMRLDEIPALSATAVLVVRGDAEPGDHVSMSPIAAQGIDMDEVKLAFQQAMAALEKGDGTPNIDGELISFIHGPLENLSRAAASDSGLWTWLACTYGKEFVWRRWKGNEEFPRDPGYLEEEFTREGSDLDKRFRMKSASLNAVSRHTLARLWWVGDATGGDYDLARRLLSNQDVFQSIFEREIGFVPGLARALADVFSLGTGDAPAGKSFRELIMKAVQQLAAVTRIETLTADEMTALLQQIKAERLAP